MLVLQRVIWFGRTLRNDLKPPVPLRRKCGVLGRADSQNGQIF